MIVGVLPTRSLAVVAGVAQLRRHGNRAALRRSTASPCERRLTRVRARFRVDHGREAPDRPQTLPWRTCIRPPVALGGASEPSVAVSTGVTKTWTASGEL